MTDVLCILAIAFSMLCLFTFIPGLLIGGDWRDDQESKLFKSIADVTYKLPLNLGILLGRILNKERF